MKRIVIATRNKKKKRELVEILSGMDLEVLCLDEIDKDIPEVIEDGDTFEANAEKKALEVSAHVDGMVLADDSGLAVDALDGAPGVISARFAGEPSDDERNNAKLLELLEDKPMSRRGARFVCAVALARKGKLLGTVRGECPGVIAAGLSGKGGFGYDPLFIPEGAGKTFGEFSPEEKHAISHRGKALRLAREIILRSF